MGYTLIIDNYDSFTWNVYADIAVLGGNPLVKRNDKISIEDIQVRALLSQAVGPSPLCPCLQSDRSSVQSRLPGVQEIIRRRRIES